MAYDKTRVPIADSQSAIRQIVYAHKGTGVSFTSRPPKEGFEALVTMHHHALHRHPGRTHHCRARCAETRGDARTNARQIANCGWTSMTGLSSPTPTEKEHLR